MLGTPAVLAAVAVVTALQFAFTYVPLLLLLLEMEKRVLRRLGVPELQGTRAR